MNIQLLFVVVLVCRSVDSAENNSKCKTPDSQNGTCVAVNLCPEIDAIIKDGNSSQKEFAQQSFCGFEDKVPLVCCKSSKNPISSSLYDKFFTTVKPDVPLEYYHIPGLPDRTICGLVKTRDKIYNGKNAEIGEFPWAAALNYKDPRGTDLGVQCGGALVTARFVLTAAHCLQNEQQILYCYERESVLLGEWKQSTDPDCIDQTDCADPVQKIGIEKEIPHPFYSNRFRNNDIGLIRLIRDVVFTDFIRPICLPPQDLPNPKIGENMTVIGWGLTQYNTRSDILLKVDLPLISNSECIEAFRGDKIKIASNKLCAGGNEDKDTCQGDSGGPLLRTYLDIKSLQWYQEGVVAFGLECGYGFPAVYTRVTKYINWILRQLMEKHE